MAEVTRISNVSPCTPTPPDNCRMQPAYVAVDVAAGDACYLGSDGKIHLSDGSSGGVVGTTAEVDGFAPQSALASQRQPISLQHDTNFYYATGLTPGTFLYLSATIPGGLTTVVGTKQTKPVARVEKDGARIRTLRSY